MYPYEIEPQNEPDGEGHGWYKCEESLAVIWAVYGVDGLLRACYSRIEAERWVEEARRVPSL